MKFDESREPNVLQTSRDGVHFLFYDKLFSNEDTQYPAPCCSLLRFLDLCVELSSHLESCLRTASDDLTLEVRASSPHQKVRSVMALSFFMSVLISFTRRSATGVVAFKRRTRIGMEVRLASCFSYHSGPGLSAVVCFVKKNTEFRLTL